MMTNVCTYAYKNHDIKISVTKTAKNLYTGFVNVDGKAISNNLGNGYITEREALAHAKKNAENHIDALKQSSTIDDEKKDDDD